MSKKLLLADDSVVIQKLVGLSFANEDLEIETTDNGDDAIAKAREIVPDIVLADVVMPGKSGYEVCAAIKQDPKLAHIPVLLLTGTFEAFDEARATASGSNGQITKPFEAQALVERVKQVMSAPPPAPVAAAPASNPAATVDSGESEDFDFFENDVTSLSADDSASGMPLQSESLDLTPSLDASIGRDVTDDDFFGAPGEGANDDFDTQGGGMAIGESVTPGDAAEADATIAMMPAGSARGQDAGDPLVGFEDDLGLNEPFDMRDVPSTPMDLDSALDAPLPTASAKAAPSPSAAEATVVVPNRNLSAPTGATPTAGAPQGLDEDELTVHAPTSPIDRDAAAAPSPIAAPTADAARAGSETTVVTNLDESLAASARPPVVAPPPARAEVDLGPRNIAPDDLDFSFDVSEQVEASEIPDPLAESFSSLMDISESQILGGPPAEADDLEGREGDPLMADSVAAGYDVSSSDLATAAPTPRPAPTASTPPPIPEPIAATAPETEDVVELEESFSDGLGARSESLERAVEVTPATTEEELQIGTPRSTDPLRDRIADLSPMVEQRIQETLEKVAWEAFSDLSESIVKQVIGRVEQIAWQVIPEMAETLVREEIRKMKGEKD
jgi:CheY-like chemotaxis protein